MGLDEMHMPMPERAEEAVVGKRVEQVLGIEIYDTGASANATGKGGKLTTLLPTSRSAAGVGGITVAKETTSIDVLLVPVFNKSDDEQVG